jgi:hypothetical protein
MCITQESKYMVHETRIRASNSSCVSYLAKVLARKAGGDQISFVGQRTKSPYIRNEIHVGKSSCQDTLSGWLDLT